jgi:cyclohexanecarboxylate-CoA ligase
MAVPKAQLLAKQAKTLALVTKPIRHGDTYVVKEDLARVLYLHADLFQVGAAAQPSTIALHHDPRIRHHRAPQWFAPHGDGYLAMIPLVLNSTTVLQDVWDANRALELATKEGVTFSMASSVFVADMCDATAAGAPVSPAFNKFCCAGAPIPPVVVDRARELMGLTVCSAWGMTENGAVTITEPGRALTKSGVSDGRPVPGMEVRTVDSAGAAAPTGTTGALHVRGASLFGGYLKRPELNATDADGWFDTGDLAFLDSEGYIRIDGRSKDIIIRGGENIPVVEIENLLYQHPSIDVAAIVGYPDERMGEKCCAVLVLKPDTTFTMSDMSTYLLSAQVTRSYHPERLIIVKALPRTPSGKIQKFRLREMAVQPSEA